MKKNWTIKTGKALAACLLAFSLAACSGTPKNEEPAAGQYKAGTYTASAQGNNGPVELEVTFTADAITSVVVKSQQETEAIASAPLTSIPQAIVDGQTLAVDVVSGATHTSEAILAAAEDCVAQAGGDVEALKTAGNKTAAEKEAKTLDTDLVVVGGGAAGMAATIRAEELGLNVVLVEKMSFMGGAISISGGNQVVMGSDLQKQAGVSDDSVESMVEDFMANGANLNVPELIQLYAENVGATTDWLHDSAKLNFDLDGGLHKLAEYSHDRELAYEGGGAGAAKVLREDGEASGAEVLLNTRASELITDETGAVVGVQAADEKTEYTINAKAVLLATGGYGNNKDLLNEEMKSALYYGPASSTGDGIVMATAENVKAATRLMEYGKRYPNGIEVSEGIAKSTIAGNIAAFSESAILINKEGQRVVNEKASNRTILETELKQTDGLLYLLMDASTFDIFKGKLATGGISEGDINNWLDNNGKTTPVFAHADSLAELAGIVGMDAETLENTVKTYNTFVQNGKDEEFGRAAEYLTKEIGEGQYYLVEQKPRFATTMGGLVVTTNLEVKNTSDTVIPGLYAAGETVGGVMGDDSPSGANNGWALTSGKLAAEAIAEALK